MDKLKISSEIPSWHHARWSPACLLDPLQPHLVLAVQFQATSNCSSPTSHFSLTTTNPKSARSGNISVELNGARIRVQQLQNPTLPPELGHALAHERLTLTQRGIGQGVQ